MKSELIQQACALLAQGELVAFPTETVYGLGADALQPQAIAKVFAAKGRPQDNPLIVHISNYLQLKDWAAYIPEEAEQLAQAFWPGPLTLVLPKHAKVDYSITAGQETVAVRMPRHPVALALLNAYGNGLVAPSANRFTKISPTTAVAVAEELGDKVQLILDGGACEVGVESTIVDVSQPLPALLRPGMIKRELIEEVLEKRITDQPSQQVRVPGQHAVHYAPTTATYLVTTEYLKHKMIAITARIAVLSHSQIELPKPLELIAMPNNAHDYARQLYSTLRALDQAGFNEIWIEAVPTSSSWLGIADRIRRASIKTI